MGMGSGRFGFPKVMPNALGPAFTGRAWQHTRYVPASLVPPRINLRLDGLLLLLELLVAIAELPTGRVDLNTA
jgi:hypothetical protein